MKDRLNSWFFRGWVRVPVEGTRRFQLEYTGELYGYRISPARYKTMKVLRMAAFVTYLCVYLLGALLVSDGAMWRVVALPQILTLVPMIWLGMGVGRTVLSGNEFSYRDYRAGPVRTRRSAWAGVVLTGLTLTAEIVFLVQFPSSYRFWREAVFLTEIVFCIAVNVWFVLDIKKIPCVIVKGPKEN